jgi:hypothetical protein
MTPSLDTPIIRDSVLDAALGLVADPIPNIRFNVAKALEILAVTLSSDAEGQELAGRKIVPALEKLCGDSDPDVRCALLKPWILCRDQLCCETDADPISFASRLPSSFL